MQYLLMFVLALIFIDLVRSALAVRQAVKAFRSHHTKRQKLKTTFGAGSIFNLVIMGDSTFDVRGDSEVVYGAAQAFINELSQKRKVRVHMLAKAGARSKDVSAAQLPELKKLGRVDLIVIYMGANDAFRLNKPLTVGRSYAQLFDFTEAHKIPVVASEIANYWYLDIFAVIHRILIYLFIHTQNFTIRRAAAGCKYVTIISSKSYHRKLHINRHTKPYTSDGVHPNDQTSLDWGKFLLKQAKKSPATTHVFV